VCAARRAARDPPHESRGDVRDVRGEGVQVGNMTHPDTPSTLGARVGAAVVLDVPRRSYGEASSGPCVPQWAVVRAEAA